MSEQEPQAPSSPAVDWKMVEQHLDTVFTKDCDPYGSAATVLFGAPTTREQFEQRRQLFKLVFFRVFQLRATDLFTNTVDYAQRLMVELKQRGQLDELDAAIRATEQREERTP